MASPSPDTSLKAVQLYGGAFACSLPAPFEDISTVREVPDNQEVFAHSSCDQSIIIELVEFQCVPDDQAARYHFQDLAESNGCTQEDTNVLSVLPLPKDQLSLSECANGWLLSGTQKVAKFNKAEKSSVKIILCVLRLPVYTTDVLISFNCPSEIGADDDTEMFASIVGSVKLLKPSIFG